MHPVASLAIVIPLPHQLNCSAPTQFRTNSIVIINSQRNVDFLTLIPGQVRAFRELTGFEITPQIRLFFFWAQPQFEFQTDGPFQTLEEPRVTSGRSLGKKTILTSLISVSASHLFFERVRPVVVSSQPTKM